MEEIARWNSSRLSVLGLYVALLLLSIPAASAEVQLPLAESASPWAGLVPTSSKLSLLDLSKLDVSHRIVFSYGTDYAGGEQLGGLVSTRFRYPLSGPLTLDLSIGTSLSHSDSRGLEANRFFLENLSLRYRPSDSVLFQFMYREFPSYYPYSPVCPRY